MIRRQIAHGIKCSIAGCKNLALKKKCLLCSHHYGERRAKDDLEKYIGEYCSPIPQNNHYFTQLASNINWSKPITTHDVRRFRAIGNFLMVYELPRILTWKVIDEARPRLRKTGSTNTKLVRSGLFDLGQLYAERGLLPDWNSYLLERRLHSLKSPPIFREDVSNFQEWALGGMLNPKSQPSTKSVVVLANTHEVLLSTVGSINIFLNWCVRNRINSLGEVNAGVVDNYLQTLLWQFRCSKCGDTIPFDSSGDTGKCASERSSATHSYIRVKHLARNSRISIVSRLRVFFDWALLHGVVTHNPLENTEMTSGPRAFTVIDERGKSIEVAPSIRRYDDGLIQKLCAYIVSPQAEPTEAIIYYLVIFHLLEVNDLCNLKIPSLVSGDASIKECQGDDDYRYLLLPPTKLSRGRRLVRRPGRAVKFPSEALPWLVPLLKRLYEKRKTQVKALHNEYLLVAGQRTRHNKPVSRTYVFELVQRGSERLLGGTVNLSSLRQTAAAIFSARSKRRSAVLTKMGLSIKWSTRFNYLETFTLKPNRKDRTVSHRKNAKEIAA